MLGRVVFITVLAAAAGSAPVHAGEIRVETSRHGHYVHYRAAPLERNVVTVDFDGATRTLTLTDPAGTLTTTVPETCALAGDTATCRLPAYWDSLRVELGDDNDRLHVRSGTSEPMYLTASGDVGRDVLSSSTATYFSHLEGGAGDDTLQGGEGGDYLLGGPGADVIRGGGGADRTSYLGDPDLPLPLAVQVTLDGVADDGIFARGQSIERDNVFPDVEAVHGGAGNDRMIGANSLTIFHGEAGDDMIDGRGGDDALYGGPGSDRVTGGAGRDNLQGEEGADTVLARDGEVDQLSAFGIDRIDADPFDVVIWW